MTNKSLYLWCAHFTPPPPPLLFPSVLHFTGILGYFKLNKNESLVQGCAPTNCGILVPVLTPG